jgi:hypothetical protein
VIWIEKKRKGKAGGAVFRWISRRRLWQLLKMMMRMASGFVGRMNRESGDERELVGVLMELRHCDDV